MAKGDAIIVLVDAAGKFEPAAGVEVLITTVTNTAADTAVNWGYWDTAVRGFVANIPIAAAGMHAVLKMPIKNGMSIYANAAGVCGGIQIK